MTKGKVPLVTFSWENVTMGTVPFVTRLLAEVGLDGLGVALGLLGIEAFLVNAVFFHELCSTADAVCVHLVEGDVGAGVAILVLKEIARQLRICVMSFCVGHVLELLVDALHVGAVRVVLAVPDEVVAGVVELPLAVLLFLEVLRQLPGIPEVAVQALVQHLAGFGVAGLPVCAVQVADQLDAAGDGAGEDALGHFFLAAELVLIRQALLQCLHDSLLLHLQEGTQAEDLETAHFR